MWVISDHVCRQCMGRIIYDGDIYMCADCEATTVGKVEDVCACGAADGSLKCVRNPDRGAGKPMVAVQWIDMRKRARNAK